MCSAANLSSRERVLAALRHEQPDRTPRDFWAEPPAWKRLFAHVGHSNKDKLLDDLGVDILDPIQPAGAAMQPENLKREFGDQLSFHGAMAHLFQPDVPPENILAVYGGCAGRS